ncbi:L-histidine N(alpha)-methyltransferase [Methylocapsa acidiphila]|uniref:L-histidine N(alpha)-methyltransferase n=1 Tax=Methylocapsa acidiphila TaxID=133552 RepID=UPI00040942E9|nr:L-histidine N(alpha)-methyltransferase [Methylocapsa acidiphila]
MTRPAAAHPLEAFAFADQAFAADVIDGLSRSPKSLSPRYFYDALGSDLFERITQLPEYYLTLAEASILKARAAEIAHGVPPGGVLLEFGSGSSRKTEFLLDALPQLAAYVAADVSETALDDARRRLATLYPSLDIRPIVADFSHPIECPPDLAERPRIGFFPGSTIGNLLPADVIRLLLVMGRSLGSNSRLIVGVDIKKDAPRLVAAYNDSAGVTAAFNLNLLTRINRELGGSFDLTAFQHRALYNAQEGRIEMHLVSLKDLSVKAVGRQFHFRAGESIHTENSYKYAVEEFQGLAISAGWIPRRVWLDEDRLFSLHELIAP